MKRSLSIVVGLALLTAACSSDGDDAEAAPTVIVDGESAADATDSDSSDTGSTDSDSTDSATGTADGEPTDEEVALEFAQCMRDNGLPDFPDPAVNADGSIELVPGGPGAAGIDADSPELETAIDACGDILEGATFLPGADLDDSEIEDNLLAFAQCLRDLGHDVADPDMSQPLAPGPDGPGGMFASGFDPQDPANSGDVQTCQTEAFGADFGPGGN